MTWRFELRADAHECVLDGTVIALTPKEADALRFLLARARDPERSTTPVSRTTLEREVWGYRAGVRSDAVPTAMRRLRTKIGDLLETVRGVGWRLNLPAAPVVRTLPRFGTPYHARPDETAVAELLDDGWRVVTVVGPGGAGKTRLVAELARRSGREVVWVGVGALRSRAAVESAIAAGSGISADLDGIATGLAERDALLVIDEAEAAVAVVSAVVAGLAPVAVLVTSRRELGLPDEAVHEMRPLAGASGRAFLQMRLKASRWASEADDALLDRALRSFDGLPLHLELVAGHPAGLEACVRAAEQGTLPEGPAGERLVSTVRGSVERLEPAALEVLSALSLCEAALRESEIREWLGPDAIPVVHEVASRSLLVRRDSGWAVLRTVRAFVRSRPADWDRLQSGFDAWLVSWATRHSAAILASPREVGTQWARLADDMQSAIGRIPDADVQAFCVALVRFYTVRGPEVARETVLRAGLARSPDDPFLRLLSIRMLGLDPVATIEAAEATGDVHIRVAAAMERSIVVPHTLRHDELEQLARDATDPTDAVTARVVRATSSRGRPEEATLLADLVRDTEPWPVIQSHILRHLAFVLDRRGDTPGAMHALDRSIAIGASEQLFLHSLVCRHTRAYLQERTDPDGALEALRDVLHDLRRAGNLRQSRNVEVGLGIRLYGRGAFDEAAALLQRGLAIDNEVRRVHVALLLDLIRADRGDAEARSRLESLDAGELTLTYDDGSDAAPDLVALVRSWLSAEVPEPLRDGAPMLLRAVHHATQARSAG